MAMPKKNQTSKIGNEVKAAAPTATPQAAPAKVTTPVRNTAVPPKATTPVRKEVTHDMIAKRAYEIAMSGQGGSEFDNWMRAERELKGL